MFEQGKQQLYTSERHQPLAKPFVKGLLKIYFIICVTWCLYIGIPVSSREFTTFGEGSNLLFFFVRNYVGNNQLCSFFFFFGQDTNIDKIL